MNGDDPRLTKYRMTAFNLLMIEFGERYLSPPQCVFFALRSLADPFRSGTYIPELSYYWMDASLQFDLTSFTICFAAW